MPEPLTAFSEDEIFSSLSNVKQIKRSEINLICTSPIVSVGPGSDGRNQFMVLPRCLTQYFILLKKLYLLYCLEIFCCCPCSNRKNLGTATTEAVKNTQRLNHSIETSISSSNQTINLLSLVLIKNAIVKENIFWLQVQ